MPRFPHETITKLRLFLEEADPSLVTTSDAAHLVSQLAEVERLAAAGKVLFARRASESRTWAAQGHRSAAQWLAHTQKSSLADAMSALETSRRMEGLGLTADALRKGEISPSQAKEITVAAEKHPSSEKELVAAASQVTLKDLKAKAREVLSRSSHKEEELARYNRIRAGRYLRHWSDDDGAFRLEARLTPDDGARVASAIEAQTNLVFDEMRKKGERHSPAAYRADALVALVTSTNRDAGSGRSDTVVVRVDAAALKRGHTQHSELCEVQGVGAVPVATVKRILPEAFVKVLVTDSVDVTSVCHLGRTVTAHVKSALEERDRTCVVPGCDVSFRLETHHWREEYRTTRTTNLDELARVCKAHHDKITYEGFKLTGGPGRWELRGPGTPEYSDTG